MSSFFQKTGPMAIATRMRMLSERMTKDAEKICNLYNVDIKLKWYPVFFVLKQSDTPLTVTQIAEQIEISHVAVVKIVKEMSKASLLVETKDDNDGRKTNIILSQKGEEVSRRLDDQHKDVTLAMHKMLDNMENNLWLALDEFEEIYEKKSTYPRVLEEQRLRESSHVTIIDFEEKYTKFFEVSNKKWIEDNFTLEQKDKDSLERPKETILDKGGKIVIALYDNEPIGTCGLMKMSDSSYDYEVVKMVVDDVYTGKGIGLLLMNAILDEAKKLGAKKLFIETNTVLSTAINLYKKVGFKKISGYASPYERSNYHMELILD